MTPKKKPTRLGGEPRASLEQQPLEAQLLLKNRALNEAMEGITIADATMPDEPLIYVNKGFERLTGYGAEEVIGHNCRFLQGEATDDRARETIRTAIREKRECVVEILNYRKNGEPFWNRLSITPIRNSDGAVTHFLGIQSDVTARRRAEDALKESNRKLAGANRSIKRDLEIAAQIQRGFLPDSDLRLPGLQVAWELHSCEELTGDTLNAASFDERYSEFYVIDVSGHGAPAALLSVTLNHWLSPAANRPGLSGLLSGTSAPDALPTPVAVVEALNRQFPYNEETNQFFTLVYGVYDSSKRRFSFVSAGHPSPIQVRPDGESIVHDLHGFPVGVVPDPGYEMTQLDLRKGDRILLYSDGLIEALDDKQEQYGVERIREVMERTRHETLRRSVSLLADSVKQWSGGTQFEDDVSLLAFEVG